MTSSTSASSFDLPVVVSEDGVDVIAGREPQTYWFIPRVQPELTSAGAPTVLLLKHAQGGLLQAGAHFDVDAAVLPRLRTRVQAVTGSAEPILLTPPPLTVTHVSLVLKTDEGDVAIADAQASAMPPYAAIFRAPLTAPGAMLVEAALRGETGRLRVVYSFEVSVMAGASVRVETDVERARADLGDEPSTATTTAWVERAIASGRVRIDVMDSGPGAEATLAATMTDAKTKVAAWLRQYLSQPRAPQTATRETRMSFELHVERPRAVRGTREGDVATWFTGGRTPLVIERPPASASP
ncbi:MAG TPA: hypothetical protein VHB78_04335 [Vicinamibacterales bacterium]|jgi:hypothetical protein|nr:hypothetical protein [Vicinamibacterales bacterium]